jgi:hypothetical protein
MRKQFLSFLTRCSSESPLAKCRQSRVWHGLAALLPCACGASRQGERTGRQVENAPLSGVYLWARPCWPLPVGARRRPGNELRPKHCTLRASAQCAPRQHLSLCGCLQPLASHCPFLHIAVHCDSAFDSVARSTIAALSKTLSDLTASSDRPLAVARWLASENAVVLAPLCCPTVVVAGFF